MENLTRPTLVLNSAWQPITVAPVRRAFMKVLNGGARLLDPETYIQHDWDTWIELPVPDGQNGIRHKHGEIRVPEVIVLTSFSKFPEREVKLTRRNLLIRDNFKCQYTGQRVTPKEATIDHIMPQSRGGKTTWDNVVISCLDANAKKADRTPKEAGMKLLKQPGRPEWSPLYSRFSRVMSKNNYPKSWDKFIEKSPETYWDVELSED
jgi:5-methylcytosine-specific restriction endonuclease McrA